MILGKTLLKLYPAYAAKRRLNRINARRHAGFTETGLQGQRLNLFRVNIRSAF
jgi:hypothetical protein